MSRLVREHEGDLEPPVHLARHPEERLVFVVGKEQPGRVLLRQAFSCPPLRLVADALAPRSWSHARADARARARLLSRSLSRVEQRARQCFPRRSEGTRRPHHAQRVPGRSGSEASIRRFTGFGCSSRPRPRGPHRLPRLPAWAGSHRRHCRHVTPVAPV